MTFSIAQQEEWPEYGAGRTNGLILIESSGKKFFCSLKFSDRIRGPLSLLYRS
jgi:hypothetical protein